MTKRRKTRAPIVSEDALKEFKENIQDRELLQLAYRFEILEELNKAGILNTRFLALEALGALAGGRIEGRTEGDLQTCWPKEWGTETITLPLSLILALRDGWQDYKKAPTRKTLGEAFKIEGGGQGSHPMKARLATNDRERALARAVETQYLQVKDCINALTLDEVINQVATAHGVSFGTVKDAHKAHRDSIRGTLYELEILKGVKPSRS